MQPWAAPPLEVGVQIPSTFQKWSYRGVRTAAQGVHIRVFLCRFRLTVKASKTVKYQTKVMIANALFAVLFCNFHRPTIRYDLLIIGSGLLFLGKPVYRMLCRLQENDESARLVNKMRLEASRVSLRFRCVASVVGLLAMHCACIKTK